MSYLVAKKGLFISLESVKAWVEPARGLLDASLNAKHELNEIDWKVNHSTIKGRLTEHLCAFANHHGGGFLVYGVSSSGTPLA